MSPTALPDLFCTDEEPRLHALELADGVEAIDYLEVRPSQLVLDVHFVRKHTAPAWNAQRALLDYLAAHPDRVRVAGGERVKNIHVEHVQRVGRILRVRVDHPGDFSTYRLTLADTRMDPAYASVAFSFKAGCPTRFDCEADCDCEPPQLDEPQIDYLAKDYLSFRQALLDRLPVVAPGWVERHEADLGMVLLELLAYAGDQLSYQQDAIANEAYLSSARQRISVRRHAKLVDYTVDEGASARAFVVATVSAPYVLKASQQLLTRRDAPFDEHVPPLDAVLVPTSTVTLERVRADAAAVFETVADAHLDPSLNEVAIYTWDLADCCLPVGTTGVDLTGDLGLQPGSFLVLEETAGADTGLAADADPTHRQVVRLTTVDNTVTDPLAPTTAITRVAWSEDDSLTFPLCISRRDAHDVPQTIAVARGNVVVADHGQTREEFWPGRPPYAPPTDTAAGAPAVTGLVRGARPTQFLLSAGPLSMWRPLGDEAVADMDAVLAVPDVSLQVSTNAGDEQDYEVQWDLLEAGPFSPEFVAETTNDGGANIRFGDSVNGLAPATGSFVRAKYRIGVGLGGNVGAEALRHLLLPPGSPVPPIDSLRNPLAATGGRDRETNDQVKVRAPVAFRSPQLRAVTAADYADVAKRVPGVSGAVARFRWTGSWLTVFLIVDAKDRDELETGLALKIEQYVRRFTQTGYDLEVRPASYVALELELFICVAADRFRIDVEEAVSHALSSKRLSDGSLGFFHPDRFSFGQPLYLSALYAAVLAVPGVESVTARRFSRYLDDDPLPGRPITAANVDAGLITVGDIEVLELLGDPSLPERGMLTITTGGGR
jgi:baseplate J-like protein